MWRAKLERIMNELLDKYLESLPLKPQDKLLLMSSDAKPVGQITDEERRLYGVVRQLDHLMVLEEDAYRALHNEDKDHSSDSCERIHRDMEYHHHEMVVISSMLVLSLKERFGREHEYMIVGDDIYIVPEQPMPSGPMSES